MVHFSAQCVLSRNLIPSRRPCILSFALHFAILCDPGPPALRAPSEPSPRLPAQVTLGPGLRHLRARAKQLRRVYSPLPSRVRPRIRSTAHTSCSVPGRQHNSSCFFPGRCICPPPRHRGRSNGLLTSHITTAMLPPLVPQAHECPVLLSGPGFARPCSQGFRVRLSEVMCHCVAPVLLLLLLPHASCPLVQRRQGAFSATRPANQPRCGPAGSDAHDLRTAQPWSHDSGTYSESREGTKVFNKI